MKASFTQAEQADKVAALAKDLEAIHTSAAALKALEADVTRLQSAFVVDARTSGISYTKLGALLGLTEDMVRNTFTRRHMYDLSEVPSLATMKSELKRLAALRVEDRRIRTDYAKSLIAIGRPLCDIAQKLGVTDATVRRLIGFDVNKFKNTTTSVTKSDGPMAAMLRDIDDAKQQFEKATHDLKSGRCAYIVGQRRDNNFSYLTISQMMKLSETKVGDLFKSRECIPTGTREPTLHDLSALEARVEDMRFTLLTKKYEYVHKCIRDHHQLYSRVARDLGLSQDTVYRIMEEGPPADERRPVKPKLRDPYYRPNWDEAGA